MGSGFFRVRMKHSFTGSCSFIGSMIGSIYREFLHGVVDVLRTIV